MQNSLNKVANYGRVLFIFCIFFLVSACAELPIYHGVLWKISDPQKIDSSTSFYIFGSTHKVTKSDVKVSHYILDKFNKSSITVFESNVIDVEKEIKLYLESNLDQYIDAETKMLLYSYLNQIKATPAQIEKLSKMHPYIVYQFLAAHGPQVNQNAYLNHERPQYPGIDAKLMNLAVQNKKNIRYLESLIDIVSAWNSACPGKTGYSALISNTIQVLEGRKTESIESIDAIRKLEQGHTEEFVNWYLSTENQNNPSIFYLEKCSNKPRNIIWRDQVINLMQTKENVFVTVGIAHLIGNDNLIDLLQKSGFVATKISTVNP